MKYSPFYLNQWTNLLRSGAFFKKVQIMTHSSIIIGWDLFIVDIIFNYHE